MDQIVMDAIAKWPNVPACTGWLMLDRRGQWRMRDDACQAAGAPGEPIRHVALRAFIERNYDRDETGRWFFQNGPQRVFVDLAYTPLVVRLHPAPAPTPTLTDQCGRTFTAQAAWIDDIGNVLFSDAPPEARGNIALLHDHDLALFSEQAALSDTQAAALFDRPPDAQSAGTAHTTAHPISAISWQAGSSLPFFRIDAAQVASQFGFVPRPVL